MDPTQAGEALERQHVQQVYEAIAPHFSATRYKAWPVVENFVNSIPEGSVGADVGCGNGKYLGLNKNIFTIGSDMSANLIDICRQRGFEAMVADNLNLPYRTSCFDYIISIAVIHHFSSPSRRRDAIRELIRILKPGGKMLIFVWAKEQTGKRQFESQDVFVPWTFPTKVFKKGEGEADEGEKKDVVYQRYYHVFVEGELRELVESAGGVTISQHGYDRDNWYVIATKN
ncbi:tRNA methyltransferase, has a role in tRNA modification [Chytridiales sp. JEL 0842]|nr:tRNA methyltransferase, has a role in tRNA modification [Chytridiales sp. JEL 0842]